MAVSFLLPVASSERGLAATLQSLPCKPRPKVSREEKEKTVVDYLMEVPANLLNWNTATGQPFTLQQRFDRIRVCDEKNGYLEIDNSDLDGDWLPVVVYFKRPNRPPLLVFGFQNSNLVFLEKQDTSWVDVSTQLMPRQVDDAFINNAIRARSAQARKLGTSHRFTDNASDPAVIYELPRVGKTIRAVSGNGGKGVVGLEIFKLVLSRDGSRFEVR